MNQVHRVDEVAKAVMKVAKELEVDVPLPDQISNPFVATACMTFFVLGYHFAKENPEAFASTKEYSFRPTAALQG